MGYTVNISGHHADRIKAETIYNAYEANGVTAVETCEREKHLARVAVNKVIRFLGLDSKILYVFE